MIAGFNDGGNLLASAASSRIIPPPIAFWLIVVFAFAGPFALGTAVAKTLGDGIADYHALGAPLLLAAVLASLCAVLAAYIARVPTSMGLALVCAMVGSLLVTHAHAIHWPGVWKVLISTAGAGVVGFTVGAAVFRLLRFLLRPVSRQTGDRIMRLQYATVALQALGYGANDAEKMVGMMAAAGSLGTAAGFHVPVWTILASVSAFAVGLAFGGIRVARTIGGKVFTIRPIHALAFQAASSGTVMAAALAGGPLSTTDTTASAIVGVGAASGLRSVHWEVVGEIVKAQALTVPVGLGAGAIAGLIVGRF